MKKDVLFLGFKRIRESARLLARVFRDNSIVMTILKNISPDNRLKRLESTFFAYLQVKALQGMLFQIRVGGRYAAIAIVHPSGGHLLPRLELPGIRLRILANLRFYDFTRLMTVLRRIEKQYLVNTHCYLEILRVNPIHQEKRVSSTLLEFLIEIADQDDVSLYLETFNVENVLFYQRFGFQVIREEEVLGVKGRFMWRNPSKIKIEKAVLNLNRPIERSWGLLTSDGVDVFDA